MSPAFEAGGWLPAIEVDGTELEADAVFQVVAQQLRTRGVTLC